MQPAQSSPSRPLPAGACDCHFHVFGPAERYPYGSERTYNPPDASIEQHAEVCRAVGLERGVLIQPSVYGLDNRLLVDTLIGNRSRLRGVAVVSRDVQDSELEALARAGVRGVRVNPRFPGGIGMKDIKQLAPRIAPLGWHIQLIIGAADFVEYQTQLAELPVPIVVDHMGHMAVAKGLDQPGFRALFALLRSADVWVKLSAPYLISANRRGHADVLPLMRALVEAAPERVIWGSNWPHPGMSAFLPDEAELLSLLDLAVPSDAAWRAVLADNPARLYGFASLIPERAES